MRNILLISFVLYLSLFLYYGCEDEQHNLEEVYIICGVMNPDWFMNLIEEIESDSMYYGGSIIYQHEYKDTYFFHLEIPVSSCAYCRLYDCDGDLVEWSSETEFQDYLDNRTNETIIWPWDD